MPWVVALIGVFSFLSGLMAASGEPAFAGWLIAGSVALALWLRWFVVSSIDHAFEKGVGYGVSTRRRIRLLPEAHEVLSWSGNSDDEKA